MFYHFYSTPLDIITQIVEFVCILTLLIMFFHGIIYLLKEWLDEENMALDVTEPLSSNCYVKDKGINTLSYLELIIKKASISKRK